MASSLPSLAPGRNFCAKEVTAPHRNPVQTIRVIGRPARLYVTTRSAKITLKRFLPQTAFYALWYPKQFQSTFICRLRASVSLLVWVQKLDTPIMLYRAHSLSFGCLARNYSPTDLAMFTP